jgi:hypothetical protein
MQKAIIKVQYEVLENFAIAIRSEKTFIRILAKVGNVILVKLLRFFG